MNEILVRETIDESNLIRVSSQSRPPAVAGAVAGMVRQNRAPVLQAVGAGAVNQALKAIAIARSYLAAEGLDLSTVPAFTLVTIAGEDKTAMQLHVFVHDTLNAPLVPRTIVSAQEH